MSSQSKSSTKSLALGAVLTALVVILQLMGSFIKLGMFQVSLVLIPIVVGAALCGRYIGAWLGFVFSVVVLLNGDAAAFLAFNVPGTIITVLLKGTACGFISGLVYDLISKKNVYVGVVTAAVVCPIVNTGIFLLGCFIFFMPLISQWASAFGFGGDVVKYMFIGLAGGNFLFEFLFNIVLSPVIVRLIRLTDKM